MSKIEKMFAQKKIVELADKVKECTELYEKILDLFDKKSGLVILPTLEAVTENIILQMTEDVMKARLAVCYLAKNIQRSINRKHPIGGLDFELSNSNLFHLEIMTYIEMYLHNEDMDLNDCLIALAAVLSAITLKAGPLRTDRRDLIKTICDIALDMVDKCKGYELNSKGEGVQT